MPERDKYVLYQLAVQDAKRECGFMKRTYKDLRGSFPRILREDFCGTANICAQWVRQTGKNRAIGVDLCPETLAWGREHNLVKLTEAQRSQITLVEQDVRKPVDCQPDLVCAYNFSYFVLWTRAALLDYFRSVRESINQNGVFFLDIFGGADSFEPAVEDTEFEHEGFTFFWELVRFDPISYRVQFQIHFTFPDGEAMREAFCYDWRFWTIPEVRELLAEAGFRQSHIYWQQSDEDDEFTAEFEQQRSAINEAGWLAYIVALP